METTAHGARTPARDLVQSLFPNPVYRRKLMWGIRRKASRSLADWQLYWAAAEQDERLLPRAMSPEGSSPLFADPLVTLIEDFRRVWARRRERDPSSRRPPTPRRG